MYIRSKNTGLIARVYLVHRRRAVHGIRIIGEPRKKLNGRRGRRGRLGR